jgi:hypothetical protein
VILSFVEVNPSAGTAVGESCNIKDAGAIARRTVKAHTTTPIATAANTATQRGTPRISAISFLGTGGL